MKALFFALVSLISFTSAAAIPPIQMRFRITDDSDNVLKGATVRVYELNDVIYETENAPSVNEVSLVGNTYYTIEVMLHGFVTKRIIVQTDVQHNHVEHLKRIKYAFRIELDRASDYRHLDDLDEVADYPRAIVEFDPNSGGFTENEVYRLSTINHYERFFRKQREIVF